VSGTKMIPVLNQPANTIIGSKSMIKTVPVEISNIHKILALCGETHLKATANALGIKVSVKLEACESCAISKAKQK
jgi:hypothetical protein